jgi:hypothetical protein
MADRHGRWRTGVRTRSKLAIRALALGVLAALAAGAAFAAGRGDCEYVGYDGYAGTSRCDKRPLPVIDTETFAGRKGGKMRLSATRAGNVEDVVWDFDGDGFDDAPGDFTPEVDLPAAGSRTFALKVTDPHGRFVTAERTMQVHDGNFAPDLQVYPDSPDIVPPGSPFRLGALVRDLDDATTKVTIDFGDGTTQVYESWEEYEDGIQHVYSTSGVKTVTVTASDGVADTILSYTIRIGASPGQIDPAVYSYDANTPRAGEPTMLSEAAYDPDNPGAALSYAWDLDGDGDYDDATTAMVMHTFNGSAPVTYGVRIRDANNGETIVRRTFVPRTFDMAPQASLYVSPLEPRAGVPVTVSGYGYDFDDFDDVTLSYDMNGDGQFDEHVGEDDFEHTFPAKGTYRIGVRAEDADGGVSTHRVDAVVATAAPEGSFDYSPKRPQPGQAVTLTGTGEDPDGTNVTLQWDLDGDVEWDDGTGNTATRTFADEGWHPISLRIRDEDGDVDVVTRYIPVGDVVNHNPVAGFTWSPTVARAGDLVTFTSTSTDPDGDALEYYWELDGDENYDDGSASAASRTFATAGSYPVTLYVEDQRGGWDEVTRTIDVGPALPGGGAGGGSGGGGGGGGSASPPPDTTAPTLTVRPIAKSALKLKTVLSKGLKVPVACTESCRASLELRVSKATAKKLKIAKKAVVVGKASGQIAAGGTLTVKLTSKAKKGLKRAKSAKLTLQGTAVDAAGNKSVLPARTLTLKK